MITNLQAVTFSQTGKETYVEALGKANKLFERAYFRGMVNRFLAKITGTSHELQTLSHQPATTHKTLEVVIVSLSKIVGTEGRSEDFDADFNPLKKHNRERWISIAAARQKGVVLPAVELLQVGNVYYVRDGHHRISVAKALGQLELDAQVVN